jgi:myo-inositol-1-phosphate synthase
MPVFIAKGGYFQKQFEERGLPIIGDDIKSQVGATITHRALTQIFRDRGVRLDRTMQLNVGGNSDFVPWLTDRKWAYIRMEGTTFGNVPLNLELKLEVWDSPNSAGIVIDAVRLAKLALNNGISGALEAPSAYLMKSPPKQIPDAEAHDAVERFIAQNARTRAKARGKTRP